MSEVNEGVQIILNRMESNPEEFFGEGQRWHWIFKETLREVMTEQEKAALHAGLVKVRRLEITAKAVATVLPEDEEKEMVKFKTENRYVGQGLTATAHPTARESKKGFLR